jgi:hypothetical protein
MNPTLNPSNLNLIQVALATEMMRRAEHRFKNNFDVVLHTRPDMCLQGAMRTLSTGLAHMWRCSPLLLTWGDAIAIYPRWAADAVATQRLATESHHSCRKELEKGRELPATPDDYLQEGSITTLGVRSLEVLNFFCTEEPGCKERAAIRRSFVVDAEQRQAGERKVSHCMVWN